MRSNNKSSQVIVNANANLSDSQLGGATSANLQSSPINAGGHQTGGGSSYKFFKYYFWANIGLIV